MPRIRFTADPKLPNDLKHLGYTMGQEVDLSTDLCERWIRRNVAEYVDGPSRGKSAEATGRNSRGRKPEPRKVEEVKPAAAVTPSPIRNYNDAASEPETSAVAADGDDPAATTPADHRFF